MSPRQPLPPGRFTGVGAPALRLGLPAYWPNPPGVRGGEHGALCPLGSTCAARLQLHMLTEPPEMFRARLPLSPRSHQASLTLAPFESVRFCRVTFREGS